MVEAGRREKEEEEEEEEEHLLIQSQYPTPLTETLR